MSIISRASLADQVAESLYLRIRSGEWAVGEKMPGETVLGDELGVGRSTIREAIRQLAGRGILTTRQGAGVFIAAIDAPEAWSSTVRRADILTVIEARIAVEVEASALAAARRTPTELRAMTQALAARSARQDAAEHVDADAAFHRSIVTAAHNPILLELFDSFAPRSRDAMIAMLRARGHHGEDADHAVHEEILRAISDGDAVTAAAVTRAHLVSVAATAAQSVRMK